MNADLDVPVEQTEDGESEGSVELVGYWLMWLGALGVVAIMVAQGLGEILFDGDEVGLAIAILCMGVLGLLLVFAARPWRESSIASN